MTGQARARPEISYGTALKQAARHMPAGSNREAGSLEAESELDLTGGPTRGADLLARPENGIMTHAGSIPACWSPTARNPT